MPDFIEAMARVLGVGRVASRRLLTFAAISLLLSSGFLVIAIYLMREMGPARLHEAVDRILEDAPKFISILVGAAAVLLVSLTFRNVIVGLQRESKEYARKISHREGGTLISASIGGFTVTSRTDNSLLRRTIRELREELAALKDAPAPTDIANPNALFRVARQRLLDEAVRIDSISRRNLIIGILFSIIALAVLRGH